MRDRLDPEEVLAAGFSLGQRVGPLIGVPGGLIVALARVIPDGARTCALLLPRLLRVDLRMRSDLVQVRTRNLSGVPYQERYPDHYMANDSPWSGTGVEVLRTVHLWSAWSDGIDPLVALTIMAVVPQDDLEAHHLLVRSLIWPAQTRFKDNGPWYFPDLHDPTAPEAE